MRYDPDEALRLTLERASRLRERRRKRQKAVLSLGAGGCACAILAFGYALAAQGGVSLTEADFGAFLLPSNAGSYILAGVVAFAAGVAITLLCIRYRNGTGPGADPPEPPAQKTAPGGTGEGGAINRTAQQEDTDQTKNSQS